MGGLTPGPVARPATTRANLRDSGGPSAVLPMAAEGRWRVLDGSISLDEVASVIDLTDRMSRNAAVRV